MADLTNQEKRNLEKLFEMESGYVLSFSNRTLSEFIADSTGREIYHEKFGFRGDSKANRLRAFWQIEPNHIVGKLLSDLLALVNEAPLDEENARAFEVANRTTQRLLQGAPVIDIEVIDPKSPERDLSVLAKTIRESIDKNEPETGLDRLHTYTIKYLRTVCEERGISTDREKPLHSLLGEYVKVLKTSGDIESEMTERILKSNISILEAFNRVRNEQSLAHDNQILNYDESLLILNQITSSLRFLMAIEKKRGLTGLTAINDIQF